MCCAVSSVECKSKELSNNNVTYYYYYYYTLQNLNRLALAVKHIIQCSLNGNLKKTNWKGFKPLSSTIDCYQKENITMVNNWVYFIVVSVKFESICIHIYIKETELILCPRNYSQKVFSCQKLMGKLIPNRIAHYRSFIYDWK